MQLSRLFLGLLVGLLSISLLRPAMACPFCTAVAQTFNEEVTSSDVAVFAKLVDLPERTSGAIAIDVNSVPARAKFEITQVLKGEDKLPQSTTLEVHYFGEAALGTEFLLMGVEPPIIVWSTPIEMTPRSREYVIRSVELPAAGPERLEFFQDYLEDPEEMLSRDAYDEFAKSPYDAVKGLKEKINRERLVAWIWDANVAASHRRLYFTLLGVAGGSRDLPMLETILKSNDRQVKLGLDAAIASYLTLKGSDGVALVEDLYFKNKEAEYTDTHAAIMALRFHVQEGDVIPEQRIKEAFRHMLEQPKLADLIINDLARMNDWEVMDRMVRLFKESDSESSWVRVPVINYLRACPLPEAQAHIEELAKIDPSSVQLANNFYPLGVTSDPAMDASAENADGETPAEASGTESQPEATEAPDAQESKIEEASAPVVPQSEPGPLVAAAENSTSTSNSAEMPETQVAAQAETAQAVAAETPATGTETPEATVSETVETAVPASEAQPEVQSEAPSEMTKPESVAQVESDEASTAFSQAAGTVVVTPRLETAPETPVAADLNSTSESEKLESNTKNETNSSSGIGYGTPLILFLVVLLVWTMVRKNQKPGSASK